MSEQQSISDNGSCWDEGPQYEIPGECNPMPPRCELRAGHLGAHRSGRSEWMRNPSSFNQVSRERDEAIATIDRIDTALRADGRSAMLIITAQQIITQYREGDDHA